MIIDANNNNNNNNNNKRGCLKRESLVNLYFDCAQRPVAEQSRSIGSHTN